MLIRLPYDTKHRDTHRGRGEGGEGEMITERGERVRESQRGKGNREQKQRVEREIGNY
jgi:hypothetical protein